MIYVRPAGSLKIETKLDKPEYRPGTRAKLSIAVTDESGQPVPGAVSLTSGRRSRLFRAGHNRRHRAALIVGRAKTSQAGLRDLSLVAHREIESLADEQNRFEQALFANAGQQKSGRDAIFAASNPAIRQRTINSCSTCFSGLIGRRIAESMPYLQKFMPLLRGNGTDYTLQDSSYRESTPVQRI